MKFLFAILCLTAAGTNDPETAVRSFAEAISRWDAKKAATYVDSATPSLKLIAAWKDRSATPMPITLRGFKVLTQGRNAQAEFDTFIPGGPSRGIHENLRLILRDDGWKIIAPKPKQGVNEALSVASLASLIAHFDAVTDDSASRCAESIRVATAELLRIFAAADRKIDWPSDGFQKLLPGHEAQCVNGEPYSINENLKSKSLDDFKKPGEIVLLYDGKDKKLNFSHNSRAAVAFLDGTVRLIDRGGARRLRWK